MEIQEHEGFIDVCCDTLNMNETEIENQLRNELSDKNYKITDEPAGRIGNPGPGTIFRFKLSDDIKYPIMEE